MPVHTPNRLLWAAVVLLLLIAALTVPLLGDASLYYDERITVSHLGDMTTTYTLLETAQSITERSRQHAPAYFWMLNGWARLTGFSQVGLRYFSVLSGLLALAVLYRLAHRWFDDGSALLALAAAAPALSLFYMQEIRMYTLMTLQAVLLLWGYERAVRAGKSLTRWDALALYLLVVWMLYTHYFSILPLAGVGVYHLAFVRKDRRWWVVSGVVVAAGLTFLPWLGVTLGGTEEVAADSLDGQNTLQLLGMTLWLLANGSLLFVPLVLGGIGLAFRRWTPNTALIVVSGMTVLLGLLVLNAVLGLVPPRRSRYLLLLIPYVALLVGVGLAGVSVRWRWAVLLLMVGWLVAGVRLMHDPAFDLYTNRLAYEQADYPPFPQTNRVIRQRDATVTTDDLLLMVSNTTPEQIVRVGYIMEYYARELSVPGRVTVPAAFDLTDRMQNPGPWAAGPMAVFVAYNPQQTPPSYQRELARYIEGPYTECGPLAQSVGVHVVTFVQDSLPCGITAPPNVDIRYPDGALRLLRVDVERSGDTMTVITAWAHTNGTPPASYSYSLRVVGGDGAVIDQFDTGVPFEASVPGMARELVGRSVARFDAAAWPTDAVSLQVVVYDWQTLEPLAGRAAGAAPATVNDLGQVGDTPSQ